MQFADRLNFVETSAIRELFKLLGKPGIISFAGGFPDSAMFDVAGIQEAVNKALTEEPGGALQYGVAQRVARGHEQHHGVDRAPIVPQRIAALAAARDRVDVVAGARWKQRNFQRVAAADREIGECLQLLGLDHAAAMRGTFDVRAQLGHALRRGCDRMPRCGENGQQDACGEARDDHAHDAAQVMRPDVGELGLAA